MSLDCMRIRCLAKAGFQHSWRIVPSTRSTQPLVRCRPDCVSRCPAPSTATVAPTTRERNSKIVADHNASTKLDKIENFRTEVCSGPVTRPSSPCRRAKARHDRREVSTPTHSFLAAAMCNPRLCSLRMYGVLYSLNGSLPQWATAAGRRSIPSLLGQRLAGRLGIRNPPSRRLSYRAVEIT